MVKRRYVPVLLDADIFNELRRRVRMDPETDTSKEIRRALRKVLF